MKTHMLRSVAKEFKLVFRNGISLFMAAAPALLAVVFLLVFGAAQKYTVQLAADESVGGDVLQKLERVADILPYDSAAQVRDRVRGTDDTLGVTAVNGTLTLITEGNEDPAHVADVQDLLSRALTAGELPQVQSEAVEPKGDVVYTISMVSVLLLSLFIGGATVGLSVVSERESGMIRAMVVSPQRLTGYVLTKLIPAFLLSFLGMLAAAEILGVGTFLSLTLLAVCSSLTLGVMIFTLGAMAQNQIGAIGVLKLLMPLSVVLPISAIFVPDSLQFLYYAFPMYWQYTALDRIRIAGNPLVPCLLALLVSLPWFCAILLTFRKKVRMHTGR